jgi:hypothetical protein
MLGKRESTHADASETVNRAESWCKTLPDRAFKRLARSKKNLQFIYVDIYYIRLRLLSISRHPGTSQGSPGGGFYLYALVMGDGVFDVAASCPTHFSIAE